MKRKVFIFLYITIIFYVAIFGFFSYKFYLLYKNNLSSIENEVNQLKLIVSSIYLASPDFKSEYFRNRMKELISKDKKLISMQISEPNSVVVYSISRKNVDFKNKLFSLPTVTFSNPIFIENEKNSTLQSKFIVINKSELYPILKNLFYSIVIFMTISIIYALYLLTSKNAKVNRYDLQNIYSPLSGLVWEEYLSVFLEKTLNETKGTPTNLSLALIAIDNMENIENKDDAYLHVSRLLLSNLPSRNHIFEWQKGFAVILPETNLEESIKKMEKLRQKVLEHAFNTFKITVTIGLTCTNDRDVSKDTLIREASLALRKAIREGKNQVIAFNANPVKFTELHAAGS